MSSWMFEIWHSYDYLNIWWERDHSLSGFSGSHTLLDWFQTAQKLIFLVDRTRSANTNSLWFVVSPYSYVTSRHPSDVTSPHSPHYLVTSGNDVTCARSPNRRNLYPLQLWCRRLSIGIQCTQQQQISQKLFTVDVCT